jgi:hypothetical protein
MTQSIIAQFDRICEDGDGDIICPHCGTEIHQFFGHWVAMEHIENNRCPICDCGTGHEDCDGTYDWCGHCQQVENCDNRLRVLDRIAQEKYYEEKFEFERMYRYTG